jgi:phosphatidylglycerophosphatase A
MNLSEKLFLAFLGSGLLPKAPGTWGSLAALAVGYAVLLFFPVSTLFLLTILITLAAVKHINAYESRTGVHDDSRIVIDEVAGMWLALCVTGSNEVGALLAFVFFRIYDIWKPSVIGRIDREAPGGWGVMGDDLVAGAAAGLSAGLVLEFLRQMGISL